jgi:hypothetical protein
MAKQATTIRLFSTESKCATLGTSTVENARQIPGGGGWAPMELIETLWGKDHRQMRHLSKWAHKFWTVAIRMRLKWPRYIFEGTCTDQLLHWQCLDVKNLFLDTGIVYRRQKPVKLHEQLVDFLRQTSCFMWLTHVVVWALVVWALVVWALVEWRANKRDWNVLF